MMAVAERNAEDEMLTCPNTAIDMTLLEACRAKLSRWIMDHGCYCGTYM